MQKYMIFSMMPCFIVSILHTAHARQENYSRCNKEGLAQISDKYKAKCIGNPSDPVCMSLEKDIQEYLIGFHNKNNNTCVQMHVKYDLKPIRKD